MMLSYCAFWAFTILIFASLTLVNASRVMLAQSARPQTVRDYFLLLPERYIGISSERREEVLRSEITTVDIKSGYLSFQDSAEDRSAVALFKRPDKSYLIAVSYIGPDLRKRGDLEEVSKLYLLRYENGKWSDVTKAMLPVPFDSRLIYELPRYGTTIRVTNKSGKKIYDLMWVNAKFVLKQV